MAEFLFRRNVVLEALRGHRRQLHQLWLRNGQTKAQTAPFLSLAKTRQLPVHYADKQQLSQMVGDASHQGVVLEAEPFPYSNIDEIMALASERQEAPLLLMLDLVQGPQNIGMLLRTAEACGAHGVILQERRAPDITPHVVAFSAGASEHLLIAKEVNLVQAIQQLKERDIWIAGLDTGEDAQLLGQIDLNRSLALVVGHEGEGLRRLVRQRCDFILALPMRGMVESLNAAVSGSIALYAAWQARGFTQ